MDLPRGVYVGHTGYEPDPQAIVTGEDDTAQTGGRSVRVDDCEVVAVTYISQYDHLSDEEFTVLIQFGDRNVDMGNVIGYTMAQYDLLMGEENPREHNGDLLQGFVRQTAVASFISELRERITVRVFHNDGVAVCLSVIWVMALRLTNKICVGDRVGNGVSRILLHLPPLHTQRDGGEGRTNPRRAADESDDWETYRISLSSRDAPRITP